MRSRCEYLTARCPYGCDGPSSSAVMAATSEAAVAQGRTGGIRDANRSGGTAVRVRPRLSTACAGWRRLTITNAELSKVPEGAAAVVSNAGDSVDRLDGVLAVLSVADLGQHPLRGGLGGLGEGVEEVGDLVPSRAGAGVGEHLAQPRTATLCHRLVSGQFQSRRVGGMPLVPSALGMTPRTWWMPRPPSSNPIADAAM